MALAIILVALIVCATAYCGYSLYLKHIEAREELRLTERLLRDGFQQEYARIKPYSELDDDEDAGDELVWVFKGTATTPAPLDMDTHIHHHHHTDPGSSTVKSVTAPDNAIRMVVQGEPRRT